jgi:hypothetical protein
VCETVYESECETSFHEHEIKEDTPNCRIMQVEKCRDVTKGFTTEQECDKWPKQVCELTQEVNKRYSPQTEVSETMARLYLFYLFSSREYFIKLYHI